MKLKSHCPFSVEVEDGVAIELGMKRLNCEEGATLRGRYNEANSKTGEEREALWNPMVVETIRDYVRPEKTLVMETDEGDVELKTGTDLLARFGGTWVANEIFSGAILATILSPRQKKAWLRRIASSHSSEEQTPAPPGPKPEPTATSAESGTSADNGDASSPAEIQSGSTDPETTPSSSENAPYFR